ncbi:Hypothetical protein FKW44_013417, partial [Caligus rogercresseyi]
KPMMAEFMNKKRVFSCVVSNNVSVYFVSRYSHFQKSFKKDTTVNMGTSGTTMWC